MVLIGEDGPASEAVVVALHAGGPGELVVPVVDGWPTAHREWSSAWEHPDHPDDDADARRCGERVGRLGAGDARPHELGAQVGPVGVGGGPGEV